MPEMQALDAAALAAEIETRLRALPDRKTDTIRTLRREYSKRLSKATAKEVVDVALRLLDQEHGESRFVAYELVHYHREALRSLRQKDLERLGCGIDSWWSVDEFACYLSGPAWREHQVPDTLIRRWARSKDRWWRRAAIVSTVPLNNKARGGSGDVDRTLAVCRLLVDDHDDMVVKAMSWALRALVEYDPKAVRDFLSEHAGSLAPRIQREVRNKLTTGLKNPRRS